jgi:thiol-disulfide isomerase/thioredoxin
MSSHAYDRPHSSVVRGMQYRYFPLTHGKANGETTVHSARGQRMRGGKNFEASRRRLRAVFLMATGAIVALGADSSLEAAAAAVGFHSTVDLSAGNVEGLPADTQLPPPAAGLLPVGSQAPGFELSPPTGKIVRLSDYRGKTVLLEFFATWCPHCQAEVPHLASLFSTLPSSRFAFISVNADSEDAASVDAFEKYFSLPWPALLDHGGRPGSFNKSGGMGSVSTAYGVALYPTFFIIDAKGRVAWRADREQPDGLILKKKLQLASGS